MQLGTRTLQILKNFNSINKSIHIKPGNVIYTASPTKSILASAEVEETFEKEFALFDLSKFLSTLSLFDSPEIKLGDRQMTIKEGQNVVKYTYSDPTLLEITKTQRINLPSIDAEFELTPNTFNTALKAMSVLDLPNLAVVGDKGKLHLKAVDKENPDGDAYSIVIGKTDLTFDVHFAIDNLKLLPETYNVQICEMGIAYFKSDKLEYWVAIEEDSTFN